MEGMEDLKQCLLHDSVQMPCHLNIVEAATITDGSNRLHSLSSKFYLRYDSLMQCLENVLNLATQLKLMREGRMGKARISQADVMAQAFCRVCGERFREGMVVGVLRCSHRFHRRCIVGRFAMQRRCPTYGH